MSLRRPYSRCSRLVAALAFGLFAYGAALATPPIAPDLPGTVQRPPAEPETTTRLVVYLKPDAGPGEKPLPTIGEVQPLDAVITPKSAILPSLDAGATRTYGLFGEGMRVELERPVSIAQAEAYAAVLARDPDVASVLVDRRVSRHSGISSNDYNAWLLWNLAGSDPGGARFEVNWPQGQGSGVTVAVLDTGRVMHQDMQNVWTGGYDLINDTDYSGDGDGRDADPTDTMSCVYQGAQIAGKPHGLMVGSVIAARLNNVHGIAGGAPLASVMPVRVISSCGGWLSDVLDGMRWAVGLPVAGLPTNPQPARVLNLSLGTTQPGVACSPTIQAVVDEVRATGATIVVSTGNDGADAISVPAACQGVIAVTASTKTAQRASYANAGAGTTLAAPGGGCVTGAPSGCDVDPNLDIYSLVAVATHDGVTEQYVMNAGTSFAAPHVAAAAALLLERNPQLGPGEIESTLVTTARAFAPGECSTALCGAGMLDAEAALALQGFTVSIQASAGAVRAGSEVVLEASVGASALQPVYSWMQVSGASVNTTVEDSGRRLRFVAPMLDGPLVFEVSVTDASALTRTARTTVNVSIAPVLAPLDPIEVQPGQTVRAALALAGGGAPQALGVDAQSSAMGVTIEGAELVWATPPAGDYAIEVTPYDSVGPGVSSTVPVIVSPASAKSDASSGAGGGGGAAGVHGALLMLLAALVRVARADARWRATLRTLLPRMAALGAAGTFLAGADPRWVLELVRGGAETSVVIAASIGGLFAASFLHIDAQHLAFNLVGLILMQLVFGAHLATRGWLCALLLAAPLAHATMLSFGIFEWVAGLSTALHAAAGYAVVASMVDASRRRDRADFRWASWLGAGLATKVALDFVFVTQWPEGGAQSSGAMHAIGASIGAGCAWWITRMPGARDVLPGAHEDASCRTRDAAIIAECSQRSTN